MSGVGSAMSPVAEWVLDCLLPTPEVPVATKFWRSVMAPFRDCRSLCENRRAERCARRSVHLAELCAAAAPLWSPAPAHAPP